MRTDLTKEEKLVESLSPRPKLISWIEERLNSAEKLGINIGLQEGLILKCLCSQPHVEKVVEIGALYGCSAAWMAMGLGERGQIYTFEKDPECQAACAETFAHPDFLATGCAVELIPGDARETLPGLAPKGPFDLIFIDANKAAYGDYLIWARENIKPGGLLLIDNVHLFGSMFAEKCPEKTPEKMWQVMRQLLQDQMSDPGYHSSLLPTVEGLLLAVKKTS